MDFEVKNYRLLGSVIVVSGPSGSGKSSICKAVVKSLPDLDFSVSCTTRKPRAGETDGKDYYFIDRERFSTYISEGRFIEYAQVHSNYYGTLKSEVISRIQQGRNVLLDIDVQGAMQIKKLCMEDNMLERCTEFVFVLPPGMDVLEQRLRSRATESEESIRLRLANAKEEIDHFRQYTYCIINENLDKAIGEMSSLAQSFKLKTSRMAESQN